jgi:hypothetical protein
MNVSEQIQKLLEAIDDAPRGLPEGAVNRACLRKAREAAERAARETDLVERLRHLAEAKAYFGVAYDGDGGQFRFPPL